MKNKYEYFDRYLSGEMTEEELNTFIEKLESDELFASEFNAYSSIHDNLLAQGNNKQKLASFKKAIGDYDEEPQNKWIKSLLIVMLGSLLLVLAYLAWDNLFPKQTPVIGIPIALYEGYKKDVYNPKTLGDNLDLYDAYMQSDFDKAIKQLDEYIEENPEKKQDPKINLCKAISHWKLGQLEEAISIFNVVEKSKSDLSDDASFYKALIYYKQKNITACKESLDKIPDAANKYYDAENFRKSLDQYSEGDSKDE